MIAAHPERAATGATQPSGWRLTQILSGLLRQPSAALGAALVVVFLVLAVLGPLLAPYGVNEQLPGAAGLPPSAAHWFGTDHLGRDVFSRVALGARDLLVLAGGGTLLSVALGASLGLLSGYQAGLFDEVLMRLFDGVLAMPALLLGLLLVGSIGPSPHAALIVIVVVYTPIVARVARSAALAARSQPYVDAARIEGEGLGWILFREILPTALPALTVETALRFSYAIFLIASLGFLGIGVQPPNPNWGLLVSESRLHAGDTPWALYIPAVSIAAVVVGVNLAADGLQRQLRGRP